MHRVTEYKKAFGFIKFLPQVAVYDYIWEEDNFDGMQSREVTTHIAIHTLHLDGLRELYRHFLRLPGKIAFSRRFKIVMSLFVRFNFSGNKLIRF